MGSPRASLNPGRVPGADLDPNQSNTSIASFETQYSNLRQLANLIRDEPPPATPRKRAISLGPPSIKRLATRTPVNNPLSNPRRTPNTAAAPRTTGGGRDARSVQTTPYGVRALEMRRVGTRETPRRAAAAARRRSGKGLGRETPRDILRGLSRILPPTALVASSSPRVPLPSIEGPKARFGRHEDNFVQEQELQPPRLSLPLEEMLENDEDEPLPRPRLSILDDDTTQRSIELPRRAQSELLSDRFSRDSFGIRLSGRFDDLTGLDEDDELEEELDIQRPVFEDYELADETGLPRLDESVPELDADESISVEGQRDAMDVPDLDEDVLEDDVGDEEPALATEKMKRRPKTAPKLSRHGLPIPNLPSSMIKKVATRALASRSRARALADKEVMKAVLEATEMFFEQVSDDLGSYAQHAKRKTIDESDLVTLMRRQRQLGGAVTPFSLAQRHLPRELLQELRMPVLPKARVGKGRQQALESLNGEENS